MFSSVPRRCHYHCTAYAYYKRKAEAFGDSFNAAIPGIVASRAGAGKKALTVDMRTYVNTTELNDGLHPTDFGYSRMVVGWYGGIQQAVSMGWITPRVSVNDISG
jgi:hypothetical protein